MTIGSKLKQTLAELEGACGTLQVYSTNAQIEESKAAFIKAEKEISEILVDLKDRLRTLEAQEPQYKGK